MWENWQADLQVKYGLYQTPIPPQNRRPGSCLSESPTMEWENFPRIYELSPSVWISYQTPLWQQGKYSHRSYTITNEPPSLDPPDERIKRKSKNISEQVIKGTGISPTSKTPMISNNPLVWNPPIWVHEVTQHKKYQGIRNGTDIAVRNGYYKLGWGTSSLMIEE